MNKIMLESEHYRKYISLIKINPKKFDVKDLLQKSTTIKTQVKYDIFDGMMSINIPSSCNKKVGSNGCR